MAQALMPITPPAAYAPVIQEQALTAETLKRQVAIVREAQRAVMQMGHHYDKIPGCGDKPTLLKPGAEVIALTFQFATAYEIQQTDLGNGHREYNVTCILTHRPSGGYVGQGIGSCSTMETKYRYRSGAGEVTDIPVPKSYWDLRSSDPAKASAALRKAANDAGIDGMKFSTKKDDSGAWRIATFAEKVEHDNPADYYNTCLKMAKKRAFVDAILTSTAASDVFTQDIEDQPESFGGKPGPRRLNMDSVSTTFSQCMTVEQLDQALADLGVDKKHPDAKSVAELYRDTKALIEDAAAQEKF